MTRVVNLRIILFITERPKVVHAYKCVNAPSGEQSHLHVFSVLLYVLFKKTFNRFFIAILLVNIIPCMKQALSLETKHKLHETTNINLKCY